MPIFRGGFPTSQCRPAYDVTVTTAQEVTGKKDFSVIPSVNGVPLAGLGSTPDPTDFALSMTFGD